MPKRPPADALRARELLLRLGFSAEFAGGVTAMLDTPFVAGKFLNYVVNARPRTETAVADELIAVLDERAKYVQRHIDARH